jgi:Pretoxin HINT domain
MNLDRPGRFVALLTLLLALLSLVISGSSESPALLRHETSNAQMFAPKMDTGCLTEVRTRSERLKAFGDFFETRRTTVQCARASGSVPSEELAAQGTYRQQSISRVNRAKCLTYGGRHLLRLTRFGVATNTPCHSFRSDTTVLMADGSRKPISEVEVGDRVLTTDPDTGERVIREVTGLHVNRDSDMANVTVQDENGKVSTIFTTQTHRFWSRTNNRWEDAADLNEGELLQAFNGSKVTVVEVRTWDGLQTMYDLTIQGVHTYYVSSGNAEILVHNCGVVDDVIAETTAGGKNLTSKYVLTADEALTAGERWVGPGYREIGKPGSGVFESSDGLRRFRIDSGSLAGAHKPGVPHVHLETVSPSNVVTTNNHIPFTN